MRNKQDSTELSDVPRPLFIAGPGRSGTTALTCYLNEHPQILVCRERFIGWPRDKITPELFTPERIMNFEDEYEPPHRDTARRREVHREILESKDFAKLEYVGDKVPGYFRTLDVLAKNNPGARFLLTYRPVEEVAESTYARSKNPDDNWLGGKDGFRVGIRYWNAAMRYMAKYIDAPRGGKPLVVSYHEFFGDPGGYADTLSKFLDLDFSNVLERWQKMSREHTERRREKEPLRPWQEKAIRKLADREAETYVLRYIEKQLSGTPDYGA